MTIAKLKRSSKAAASSKSSATDGRYASRIEKEMHEMAKDFYRVGVMSKKSMREFDALCLTPVKPLKPSQIRAIRRKEEASQAVFASHLNVTVGLVSQWERGEKKPGGASLKLLTLVEKNGLESIA